MQLFVLISSCALALSLLTYAAVAQTALPACTIKASPTSVQLEAKDFGRGMTTFIKSIGPEKGRVASYLYVTNCHTGDYVRATVFTERQNHKGETISRQEYPDAIESFRATGGASPVVTLGGYFDEMKAAGVPVVRRNSRYETCACATAYPALRGTKWGYQAP